MTPPGGLDELDRQCAELEGRGMSADHVVVRAGEQDVCCTHCGATMPIGAGMPIVAVTAAWEAFAALHEDCDER